MVVDLSISRVANDYLMSWTKTYLKVLTEEEAGKMLFPAKTQGREGKQ
jgi:hypothetical protein